MFLIGARWLLYIQLLAFDGLKHISRTKITKCKRSNTNCKYTTNYFWSIFCIRFTTFNRSNRSIRIAVSENLNTFMCGIFGALECSRFDWYAYIKCVFICVKLSNMGNKHRKWQVLKISINLLCSVLWRLKSVFLSSQLVLTISKSCSLLHFFFDAEICAYSCQCRYVNSNLIN